jgi:hypothetical protein
MNTLLLATLTLALTGAAAVVECHIFTLMAEGRGPHATWWRPNWRPSRGEALVDKFNCRNSDS